MVIVEHEGGRYYTVEIEGKAMTDPDGNTMTFGEHEEAEEFLIGFVIL